MKKQTKIERPEKEKVTREEALKRVKAFGKRKEKLIAAILSCPLPTDLSTPPEGY